MPSLSGLKNRVQRFLKFGRHDHRTVFAKIFEDRHWGDEESVSGIGSRMAGDFRLLDLFQAPFSLPTSIVLDRFPDYAPPMPERDMVLIRRQDLAEHLRQSQ